MTSFSSQTERLTLDDLTDVDNFDNAPAGVSYALKRTDEGAPYEPIAAGGGTFVIDPVGGLTRNSDGIGIKLAGADSGLVINTKLNVALGLGVTNTSAGLALNLGNALTSDATGTKIDGGDGITTTSSGVELQVGGGLSVSASGLALKLAPGGGLSLTSDGISSGLTAANKRIYLKLPIYQITTYKMFCMTGYLNIGATIPGGTRKLMFNESFGVLKSSKIIAEVFGPVQKNRDGRIIVSLGSGDQVSIALKNGFKQVVRATFILNRSVNGLSVFFESVSGSFKALSPGHVLVRAYDY